MFKLLVSFNHDVLGSHCRCYNQHKCKCPGWNPGGSHELPRDHRQEPAHNAKTWVEFCCYLPTLTAVLFATLALLKNENYLWTSNYMVRIYYEGSCGKSVVNQQPCDAMTGWAWMALNWETGDGDKILGRSPLCWPGTATVKHFVKKASNAPSTTVTTAVLPVYFKPCSHYTAQGFYLLRNLLLDYCAFYLRGRPKKPQVMEITNTVLEHCIFISPSATAALKAKVFIQAIYSQLLFHHLMCKISKLWMHLLLCWVIF